MNRRAKARAQMTSVESVKGWRQVRWIMIGLFAVMVLTELFIAGVLPLRKELTPVELSVLAQYGVIRHALAQEQLDDARRGAATLAAVGEASSLYTQPAALLAHSDSLATARDHFVPLSEAIVTLVRGRPGYWIVHCANTSCPEPCENCPMDRYGEWMQASRDVENPFMGLKHTKCGMISPDQSSW